MTYKIKLVFIYYKCQKNKAFQDPKLNRSDFNVRAIYGDKKKIVKIQKNGLFSIIAFLKRIVIFILLTRNIFKNNNNVYFYFFI